MKKLIIITLNLILVFGFLQLKSQNEFNNIENKNIFKEKGLIDLNHNDMNHFPSNGTIKQRGNREIGDYGDTPNLNWKGQFGGTAYDNVNAVISDESGNIYIVGSFAGQMSLSGNTYISTGLKDAFVAKFNNSGDLIWLTQIPATENNEAYGKDICIDENGNLYITGYYTGTLALGSSNLPDINNFSLFYAKLNNLGELINGMYHSQYTDEIGFSIDIDEDENVYISCAISNSIDYRHPSCLLKYDQSNNLLSEVQYDVGFNNLIVDGNNIYYSGVIHNGDNGYLGNNVTLSTTSTYNDVFVAKSNLDGVFEWGITPTHVDNGDSGNDCITMDNNGNVFMAGTYRGSIVFGNDTIILNAYPESFITKFNPEGDPIWLKQFASNKVKLSSDSDGNAYTTGIKSLLKYSTDGIMLWEVEIENQPNTICYNSEDKIITAGSDNGLNYITQFTNEATEEWTTQFGGNSALGYMIGMVTDNNGNIYTYNYTSGTIDYFGEVVNEGIFICRQKGQGDIVWIRQFPDIRVNGGDMGNSIAIDPESENIYITGELQDELIIPGGTTLTPSEEGSIFIIKYDINGAYKWSIQEDFVGYQFCLVADYANNIILSGTFNETISISGTELVSAGSHDCFIAKYDSDANLEWAKRAGGESVEYSGLVSVDGNNNVYLTGEFVSENVTVDNTEYLMVAGEGNIFFAKLSPNGEVLWIKSFAASNHEWYDDVSWPTGIKTDIDGNTYMKGNFSYIAYFDDILLENPLSYHNKFIAKIDGDGNALWAKQITQPRRNHQLDYNQFDIDNEGNVYFGVQAEDTLFFGDDFQYNPSSIHDLFIAKYSTDGNLDWVKTMQGNESSYSRIRSVAVYNTTNVFVGGYFNNYLLIDNEELTSNNRHGFISMFGDDITSVSKIYNSVGLEVYPNPAIDKITIATKLSLKNAISNIYSVSGKLIKTQLIDNQNEIDVSNLQKGAYLIKIYSEKGVLVSSFIKL